jgi:hypothetical protein
MPDENTVAPQAAFTPTKSRWLPQSRLLRYLLYGGLAIIALNAVGFAVLLYFGTRPNLPYADYYPEFQRLSMEAHARHGIAPPQPGQPDAWVILEGVRSRTEKAIDPWIDAQEKRHMAADPPDFSPFSTTAWCSTLLQSRGDLAEHPDAQSLHNLIMRLDDAGVYRFTAMLPNAAAALPTRDDLGLDADRPSRMPILVSAQVLCLRARLAAESGDATLAITHLTEANAVADRLASQPNPLDRIIADPARSSIDDTAITLVSRRILPAYQLKQLAELLNQPRDQGFATALKGGRLTALNTLQAMYYGQIANTTTLTKAPNATGADPQEKQSLIVGLFFRTFSSHRENAATVNRIYDLAEQANATPFPKGRDLDDLVKKAIEEIPRRLAPAGLVITVMPGAVLTARAACWHAAARTAVAIERYRQDHNTLPTTLDNLIPACLRESPQDLFAPDRRLRYRVDNPKHIPGYTLYSVGYDQTDNNANPAREPFEAMRDIGKGTDYIFVSSRAAGIPTP